MMPRLIVPTRSRRRARRLWRYSFGKTGSHKHRAKLDRMCRRVLGIVAL